MTAPAVSGCCVTAPGHRSLWNGCANSLPNACSTRAYKPAPGGNGPLRLTPLQLLDRLAALVHRHRYFAVLAPNSSLRALVTAGRAGGDARLGRATVERLLSRFSTAASVGSSCRQWVVSARPHF
jgi:hypothetical protein